MTAEKDTVPLLEEAMATINGLSYEQIAALCLVGVHHLGPDDLQALQDTIEQLTEEQADAI